MGIKDILGSISPAYGVISGEGAFGKLADSGIGGAIPLMLAERRQNKKDQKSQNEVKQLKKGGAVKSSASKRADGCAQRGKTRGKIV
jgi:hypothetical protein